MTLGASVWSRADSNTTGREAQADLTSSQSYIAHLLSWLVACAACFIVCSAVCMRGGRFPRTGSQKSARLGWVWRIFRPRKAAPLPCAGQRHSAGGAAEAGSLCRGGGRRAGQRSGGGGGRQRGRRGTCPEEAAPGGMLGTCRPAASDGGSQFAGRTHRQSASAQGRRVAEMCRSGRTVSDTESHED